MCAKHWGLLIASVGLAVAPLWAEEPEPVESHVAAAVNACMETPAECSYDPAVMDALVDWTEQLPGHVGRLAAMTPSTREEKMVLETLREVLRLISAHLQEPQGIGLLAVQLTREPESAGTESKSSDDRAFMPRVLYIDQALANLQLSPGLRDEAQLICDRMLGLRGLLIEAFNPEG